MIGAIFAFGLPLSFLVSQLLVLKPSGLWVGQINLYGDMVLHLAWINSFAWGQNFPPQNPIFAGGAASYPFLADLISGLILRLGLPLTWSVALPTIFFLLVFIAAFYQFSFKLTHNRQIAYLSLFLFFFSGGLGFWYFFQDLSLSRLPLVDFLTHLPRNYTDMKEIGFWWINSLTAFLFPQRTFLLALPLAILILNEILFKKRFFLAGLLTGFLFFVHPHSTLAISFFFIILMILNFKPKRAWLTAFPAFFLPAGALSLLVSFLFFTQVAGIQQNLHFKAGWMAGQEGPIVFWFKNAGLFLPLFLISLGYTYRRDHTLAKIGLGALVLFLVPNLIIFQAWDFDNSKILVYWLLLGSILVSWFLIKVLWQGGIFKKIVFLFLVFLLTFSGFLEVFRVFFPTVSQYQIFNKDDLLAAEFVKTNTPTHSIFLTGTYHNQFVILSGRPLFMGFPGWLWSYGIKYQPREQDGKLIYQGGKAARPLLEKYQINYVVIGQFEKEQMAANEAFFKKNFPLVYQNQSFRIYQIGSKSGR